MDYRLFQNGDRSPTDAVAKATFDDEFAAEKWARDWVSKNAVCDDYIIEREDGHSSSHLFRTEAGQWYIMRPDARQAGGVSPACIPKGQRLSAGATSISRRNKTDRKSIVTAPVTSLFSGRLGGADVAMGTPTVLVVDDELLIAMSIEDAFREAGFEVFSACSGDEASAFLNEVAQLDALVTDIRIGAFSGWELADVARLKNPAIVVLYVSGDSGSQWPERGVPGSAVIQKPFSTTKIVEAVRARLSPRAEC